MQETSKDVAPVLLAPTTLRYRSKALGSLFLPAPTSSEREICGELVHHEP